MPNNHISEQTFSILSPRLMFKTAWVTHERITLGYSRYFYDQRVCEPRVWDTIEQRRHRRRHQRRPARRVPLRSGAAVAGSRTTASARAPAKQDATTRATGVQRPDENVFKIEATMWW